MAAVVDICNMALGHIANSAEVVSIDPVDGTPEADHCARFYPMARDECLERYTWSFATARKYLAENVVNEQAVTWGYSYALPNQMIRPIAVLMPGALNDAEGRAYLIETLPNGEQVLYTNVDGAYLKYVYRQEDTTKFTPLFAVALATNLASYLAGPLVKDVKLKAGLKQQARAELVEAAAMNNAQKLDVYKHFTPSHLSVRT